MTDIGQPEILGVTGDVVQMMGTRWWEMVRSCFPIARDSRRYLTNLLQTMKFLLIISVGLGIFYILFLLVMKIRRSIQVRMRYFCDVELDSDSSRQEKEFPGSQAQSPDISSL